MPSFRIESKLNPFEEKKNKKYEIFKEFENFHFLESVGLFRRMEFHLINVRSDEKEALKSNSMFHFNLWPAPSSNWEIVESFSTQQWKKRKMDRTSRSNENNNNNKVKKFQFVKCTSFE